MFISHPLTDNGQYFLDLDFHQDLQEIVATIRSANPELRSANLEKNLAQLVKIEIDGQVAVRKSDDPPGRMTWQLDAMPVQGVKIAIRDISFGEYTAGAGAEAQVFSLKSSDYLSPFELRMLARGIDSAIASQVPYDRSKFINFKPKTDLHTHFAGNITVDNLLTVGSRNGTQYPVSLLREAGIEPAQDQFLYDVADVDKTTYDLSAKNPHKKSETALREPAEILDEIAMLDQQSAEILNGIRAII